MEEFGLVAQLGAHTVQFYGPLFRDVSQVVAVRFAILKAAVRFIVKKF